MRKKLQTLRDFIKCVIGTHHLPEKLAFEEGSVFFAGGVCPRCGHVKWGKAIGDIFDLDCPQTRRVGDYYLLPNGYTMLASLNTLESIYEHYPERYRERIAKFIA